MRATQIVGLVERAGTEMDGIGGKHGYSLMARDTYSQPFLHSVDSPYRSQRQISSDVTESSSRKAAPTLVQSMFHAKEPLHSSKKWGASLNCGGCSTKSGKCCP